MSFRVIYVPIGVGTFHMESAHAAFDASCSLLQALTEELSSRVSGISLKTPEDILFSPAAVKTYLAGEAADLLILQNITFANAAYTEQVILSCPRTPVLLWTLPEPVVDGTRLRLNSLTGAFSAGLTLRSLTPTEFDYVLGVPDSDTVRQKIRSVMMAAALQKELQSLTIAQVGHTPQGFGFGRALDQDMAAAFGVRLESIEVRELINKAKSYAGDEWKEDLEDAKKYLVGLENTPEKNVVDFAKLYRAYREYVKTSGVKALSSRCWPDLFVEYGTPVCAVLSLLNAEGICSSCEADTYGALTMFMASYLTGKSCFFGDPVSVNEEENTLTFWHCGMAPCDLAREDTGACVGVHPNRKIGPTMEFGCRANESATVFRVGRKKDGSFRFFVSGGEILDKPRQFYGTSVVVKTESNTKAMVEKAVTDGWEPHFVVAYGDIVGEIESLGRMLNIPVIRY